MTSAAPPRDRVAIVDLVRMLSILAVLAIHLQASGLSLSPSGRGSAIFSRFARNGSLGVAAFLAVSGFIITETVLRAEPDARRISRRSFYVKRAARLAPLAIVVLMGGMIVLALTEPSAARAFTFRNPAASFDGWFVLSFPAFAFNWLRLAREMSSSGFGLHWDIFWSLAIEEHFYLVFPLLLRRFGTGRRLVQVLLGLVCLGLAYRMVLRLAFPDRFLLVLIGTPAGADQLALGVLACLFLRRYRDWLTAVRQSILLAAGTLVLLGSWWVIDLGGVNRDLIWGPTMIALGVCALLVGGTHNAFFDRWPRLLTYPGELSYGLYLLHATTLFVLWDHVQGRGPWTAMVIYTMTTFAVAAVSYRVFEAPTNRALRRWALPPVPAAAEPGPSRVLNPTAPPAGGV